MSNKIVLLFLILVATYLGVVSCNSGGFDVAAFLDSWKDDFLRALDEKERMKGPQMYLEEQKVWAAKIGASDAKLGNIITRVAGLEAEIAAKQYAVDVMMHEKLIKLHISFFDEELESGTGEQEAFHRGRLLMNQGLLRARATLLDATYTAWQQIYKLAGYYEDAHQDDRYMELSLGLPRRTPVDMKTQTYHLEVALNNMLWDKSVEDVEILLEKINIMLDGEFKCNDCQPSRFANNVTPLAKPETVESWVKDHVGSSFLDVIREATNVNTELNIQGSVDLEELEKFRRSHLQRAGLWEREKDARAVGL